METEELIQAEAFCASHQIEFSFITSLQNFGLLQVAQTSEATNIPVSELKKLEQFVSLYYDLDINLEGIDVITHLLDKVKMLQTEITSLKNRLHFYEPVP